MLILKVGMSGNPCYDPAREQGRLTPTKLVFAGLVPCTEAPVECGARMGRGCSLVLTNSSEEEVSPESWAVRGSILGARKVSEGARWLKEGVGNPCKAGWKLSEDLNSLDGSEKLDEGLNVDGGINVSWEVNLSGGLEKPIDWELKWLKVSDGDVAWGGVLWGALMKLSMESAKLSSGISKLSNDDNLSRDPWRWGDGEEGL